MKSRVYRNILLFTKKMISYCKQEENKRATTGIIAVMILLAGIQLGDYISSRNQYLYNDKGELVAYVRKSDGLTESLPLRINITSNGSKKAKNIVVTFSGDQSEYGDHDEDADNEAESMQSAITKIVSEISKKKDKIVYFPLKEDGMDISWEKQRNYSYFLIPLLFPLSLVILKESRSASEKKKRENQLSCVKKSLPRFCNQLLLMMGSGIILEDAFYRIACMYESGNSSNEFKSLVMDIKRQCDNTSDNVICALKKKSGELNIRELSRLTGILEANQKKGTDLTSKLILESELLWNERKTYAEEKGRAADIKLSFPLAALLVVLILVTAAPAMMEM